MKKEMQLLEHEKKIEEYRKTIDQLIEQNKENPVFSAQEVKKMEKNLHALEKEVYSHLTPWQRVTICRHPARPHSIDYIENICEEFEEIHGDRAFADDAAIICGFAKISGKKFVIIAQEKGSDTESRMKRNFGMPHPEGYRKALRAMQLAQKFKLPVLSLLDTPGAYPGLTAEERGQGWAIAFNLREMSQIETPIICLLIGEGCSGGALGMGIGDIVTILEHSYYSVISPEGCASILWNDTSKNAIAAAALQMHGEFLKEQGVVDDIIEEPLGGAHKDPAAIFAKVKAYLLDKIVYLESLSKEQLLDARYEKFRKIGKFEESFAAR